MDQARTDTDDRALALDFDLARLDRAFLDDPYPTYHALRRHAPVQRQPDGSYFLTRHRDLVAVYHDPVMFSSDKTVDFGKTMGATALYEHHTTTLVFNDPPYHTRVRRLLQPAFTPRALAALRPRIERLVDTLLDLAEERGRFDMISDVAAAVPIQLIGDMLGIPQDEREPLRRWSSAILNGLEPRFSSDQLARGSEAVEEFKDFLRSLIAERRRRPAPEGEGEVLSKLLAPDERGETLTELELLHNCIFLLNAGHETTTNLIGNSVEALLRFPTEHRRLRENPTLVASAVEEFLRYESSNQIGNRRTTADTEVGGVPIPAGTYLHLGIGAANRDPEEFPDPDRLDIARTPNRHLAFGAGIHACAGMSLGRMEAQVTIGKLVARFPKLRPDGAGVRGGRARFRGFTTLPVAV
jgi:cytochrome P450